MQQKQSNQEPTQEVSRKFLEKRRSWQLCRHLLTPSLCTAQRVCTHSLPKIPSLNSVQSPYTQW